MLSYILIIFNLKIINNKIKFWVIQWKIWWKKWILHTVFYINYLNYNKIVDVSNLVYNLNNYVLNYYK